MLILGLDPSSTCTGYAVVRAVVRDEGQETVLLDAGYLKPAEPRAAPMRRIESMVDELAVIIKDHRPDMAIVEVCSGHAGVGQRHHAGARLAVYGMAVGAMWEACRVLLGDKQVEWMPEDVWTAGVPKAERQAVIAALYPAYAEQMAADAGGDVSDAIGLILWWIRAHELAARLRTVRERMAHG